MSQVTKPRLAFYVHVGDMPPPMARSAVDEVRKRYQQEGDIFIPVREGPSRVEVLVCPKCQVVPLTPIEEDLGYLREALAETTDPEEHSHLERSILALEETKRIRDRLKVIRAFDEDLAYFEGMLKQCKTADQGRNLSQRLALIREAKDAWEKAHT